MKLIGVHLDGQTWVAQTHDAQTPTRGSAALLQPLAEFWADPYGSLQQGSGREIEVGPGTDAEVVPPVLPGAQVLCLGLNYQAHIEEGSFAGRPAADHPTVFGRWARTLVAGGVPVPVPSFEPDGLDWEGEIAAWVGRELCAVSADQARESILGLSTFNDLSARTAQKLTSQWTLGKNADRSGPIGPLVTSDEAGDLRHGLRLRTMVNGEVVQESTTDRQIFEAGDTLSLISRVMTLRPGDILVTGTPSGVGYARTPPRLLGPGDVVDVEADRLGRLTTPVVAHRASGTDHPEAC